MMGMAIPTKWTVPGDSEAWPDTGQVMDAQEAAVVFNALIDRLTQIDRLAQELAEMVLRHHNSGGIADKARQL